MLYVERIKGHCRKCRTCVFGTLADCVISLGSFVGFENEGCGDDGRGRGKYGAITEFIGLVLAACKKRFNHRLIDDGIKKDNA